MKKISSLALVALISLSACSKEHNPFIQRLGLIDPPKAGEKLDLIQQAKRYRGQTSFLSLQAESQMRAFSAGLESAAPMAASANAQARAVQESDIFKVGKPGSKTLYLLNNSRGLQVVSFAKGAEQPELVGRVKASGNYPKDMYYDAANDRLIVLENVWERGGGSYESNGKLVVYDVSNSKAPKVAQEVDFKGSVADSRMVGDVLYVASSAPAEREYGQSDDGKRNGFVTSFSLGKNVKQVNQHQLTLPSVSGEQMNIQTVEDGKGGYKYYLVAILSETGWSWWSDRNAMVEVVDISDDGGKIEGVMTVSVKGSVEERSQTLIKNGTLIVTSNYSTNPKDWQAPHRVAVETFTLPTSKSEILKESEANFRKVYIEHELDGKTGKDYDDARAKLVADASLGIKGRFVKTATGVRKMIADSVKTVGDTTGQSARLQDVRYSSDGKLYAFWVPANNIDPLDIFDISQPEKGVEYLAHLEFDGWISRSEPMSYNGRQFLIGLGWVIPRVDNENNRRHPQAAIFEITQKGKKIVATQISQLSFEGSNIWTDFNSPDKYTEFRFSEEGVGEILFSASSWDKSSYQSGGKLVKFNLKQIIAGKEDESLSEGAFLAGNSGWLRRVFTNAEISRINTFSDQALGVFNPADKTVASASGVVKASAILELARNIRGYETLGAAGSEKGLQIISEYNYWGAKDNGTELRLVDAKAADAEKPAVIASVRLPGSYSSHRVDGSYLYVLTSVSSVEKGKDGRDHYVQTYTVSTVQIGQKTGSSDQTSALSVAGSVSWKRDESQNDVASPFARMSLGGMGFSRWSSSGMEVIASGVVLVQAGGDLKAISAKNPNAVVNVGSAGCSLKDKTAVVLKKLGSSYYLTSKTSEQDKSKSLYFTRNYLAPVTFDAAANKVSCGKDINVPGEVVTVVTQGGQIQSLISQDTWLKDTFDHRNDKGDVTYTEMLRNHSYTALTVQGDVATLTDEVGAQAISEFSPFPSSNTVRDGEIVFVSSKGEDDGYGGISPWRRRRSVSSTSYEFLTVNAQGLLTGRSYAAAFASDANLLGVVADPAKADTYLGVVSSGGTIRVISWTGSDRPVSVQLAEVNEAGGLNKASESVETGGGYWSFEGVPHFTPGQRSIELSQGLNGVRQFLIK